MRLRSLLFVPGDSERKMEKAKGIGADALILDLEDAVAPTRKAEARGHVAARLADDTPRGWRFWVRVNGLDTGFALDDLAAIVQPGLNGILLPKANGAEDLQRLSYYLDVLEVRAGISPGSVRVAVVCTETPRAMLTHGGYADGHPRLAALTWGAEDLSSAIGAVTNTDLAGDWSFPYLAARAMCLFTASAAGAAPIETLFADYRDPTGLERSCVQSRRDGFTGRVAIHPDQVEIINRCYLPSSEEVELALRIVAAFDAAPENGAIGLNGRMYDIPHLTLAKRTLALAEQTDDCC